MVLNDANEAGYKIDRAFESLLFYKQPIYIELPCDIAEKSISYDVYRQGTPESPKTDKENLEEAVSEVKNWISSAKKPVILAGVELVRFGLESFMQKFAERTNIPIAVTLLSKGIISEKHPLYLGMYQGNFSQIGVKEGVDESDCLLMFGVLNGDTALKHIPVGLVKRNAVSSTVGELRIKNHAYKNVQFEDFCKAIFKAELPKKLFRVESRINKDKQVFLPNKEKVTLARTFQKINSILNENIAVIADSGNSLFGAIDLMVHSKYGFFGSALYCNKGSAISFSLGTGVARPSVRSIVVVGDGAFQMSSGELGSLIRHHVNAIIVVLNNGCYATDCIIQNGNFNKIPRWDYHKFVDIIGGTGYKVNTEEELNSAFDMALKTQGLNIINVIVEENDISSTLLRMKGFLQRSATTENE